MNITHAIEEKVKGDKLVAIFNRQKELMTKYHDIEKRSGLLQTEDCPVNLDDKRGQARIKDFAWRIMEEVGEALDAKNKYDVEHFKEELIDGLHFLTELSILSGAEPKDVVWQKIDGLDLLDSLCQVDRIDLDKAIINLVMDLGMMCNCLKNKPWKQTSILTDKDEFYYKLLLVWSDYINLLLKVMDSDEIISIYLKKSQVNQFRQRSNY